MREDRSKLHVLRRSRFGLHLDQIRPHGLGGISEALNKQGIRTARGKRWHVSSVANLLERAKALAVDPRTGRLL
jgi:Recombinase